MKKHYKIILANAPINNGNRGCVALSITVMSIIDKIFKQADLDYEVVLSDSEYSPSDKRIYKSGDFNLSYSSCDYFIGMSRLGTLKKTFENITKKDKLRKVFKTADFILDIGQGDSFTDIYGDYRFRKIDRIHKIARLYSKPYCILPQTIGPFNDPSIKSKADLSISKASLCMARDKQSYDYVFSNVPDQKTIKEYIDVAFFMPYTKIEQDSSFVHVGLNISALMWNGGYTGNNQFGLKDDYKTVVRSIIDYFLSLPNIKLHLVPHVVLQERNIENDYEVSYDLWREYNNSRLVLAPFALGPIEIKSYIAGLDFFMGARMHATIGAFSSGVPVVPMAYSRKFNGLFEDTLDYHYMTDLKVQTKEEVLASIKDAFEKRNELKEIINNRMNTIVKEREQLMYDELRKFFKLI